LPDETPDDATPEAEGPVEVEPAPAAASEPEPEPEPDPVQVELLARLDAALGDALLEHADMHGTLVARVRTDAWAETARTARTALECDYLSFISGIDWAPAPREGDEAGGDTSAPVQPTEMTFGAAGSAGRFQVFAHVQSTAKHWGVTFKVDVDEADPAVESWVPTYAGADWHERECWEMYGVRFDGHPSLRHLYLPAEFEGHPLRKDFPLLARVVKPWPGLVDVEGMPEEASAEVEGEPAAEVVEASASEPTDEGGGDSE
jgi:NADH-quinone oxidoreductase subunit C